MEILVYQVGPGRMDAPEKGEEMVLMEILADRVKMVDQVNGEKMDNRVEMDSLVLMVKMVDQDHLVKMEIQESVESLAHLGNGVIMAKTA